MTENDLLGVGIYTAPEAGRYTGISSSTILRWLKGHSANGKTYAPLWTPEIAPIDEKMFLSFRDLMELRTISYFLRAGVSPHTIRKAIMEARKAIGESHPLSSKGFKTDGRTIFLEIAKDDDDPQLLDLVNRQYAFKRIIDQSLRDVEFEDKSPARWWISSKKNGILIDPKRSFGQPIDDASGIPIEIIASAVEYDNDLSRVARDWEIPLATVRRAVEFNNEIMKKAA